MARSHSRSSLGSGAPAFPSAILDADLDRNAVIRVAAATAAANTVEEVLELAAEEALDVLGAASLSISSFATDAREVHTLINVGDLAPGEERYPADETYSFDEFPLVERLIRDREPYFNTLEDPDCLPGPARVLRELGKNSDLGVPIEVEGEVWGEAWAARASGVPPFGDREAAFLSLIAEQVSIVVKRALELSRVATLAYEDDLTGLANRRSFRRDLDELHDRADRGLGGFSVLLCDVDGLKRVNDVDGHEAGDQALELVGRTLKTACARVGGRPARLAGDEFGVLLADADLDAAVELGGKVIEALGEQTGSVSLSCGAAAHHPGVPASDILATADAAVYCAKQEGGRRVSSFPAEATALADRRRRTFRGRPADRVRAASTELADALDSDLATAPVLERLEAVARALSQAGDFASWAISRSPSGSDRLIDLSVGENASRRYVSVQPGPDTGEYALEDFPTTAAAVAAGSGLFVNERDDPECEPAERELLERYGVRAVVGAVASSAGDAYLLELYADEFTPAPGEIGTALRLLCRAAMPVER
ncbi:sensor domain-containing diguanylate cyclase [Thermoleophilia bacterium SCSIO 60948]|nr:sensor domain-containing diguanylate cyclase [Thermoleophilia bacterium SCSIO 60948]